MATEEDEFPWSLGVFDAHCHPTDTMASISTIPSMNASAFAIMATRGEDQHLVEETAQAHAMSLADLDGRESCTDWRKIVPSFGWHPWFSYQLYDNTSNQDAYEPTKEMKIKHYEAVLTPKPESLEQLGQLPDPKPLSDYLAQTQARLEKYPTALIGEVGLDKAFRLPEAWMPGQTNRDEGLTPGGREGRRLSPFRVQMHHQVTILLAQLRLAAEHRRAVSMHGVQAHGILFQTLQETWRGHEKKIVSKTERKRRASASNAHVDDGNDSSSAIHLDVDKMPYPPRVCLHSYSGPPDFLKQYFDPAVPVEFFVSFSTAINFSSQAASKTEACIKATPEERLLVESDLHTAGSHMDENLEDVVRKICALRSWTLKHGVKQLGENWKAFVYGVRAAKRAEIGSVTSP